MHRSTSLVETVWVLVALPDTVTLTSRLDSGAFSVVASALETVGAFSAAGLTACGSLFVFMASLSF